MKTSSFLGAELWVFSAMRDLWLPLVAVTIHDWSLLSSTLHQKHCSINTELQPGAMFCCGWSLDGGRNSSRTLTNMSYKSCWPDFNQSSLTMHHFISGSLMWTGTIFDREIRCVCSTEDGSLGFNNWLFRGGEIENVVSFSKCLTVSRQTRLPWMYLTEVKTRMFFHPLSCFPN